MIKEVTGEGYSILFSDIDAIFLRDPIPFLNSVSGWCARLGAPAAVLRWAAGAGAVGMALTLQSSCPWMMTA